MKRLFIVGFFFFGMAGYAQQGAIKGIVRDGINNDTSPFVAVHLSRNIDNKLIGGTNSDKSGKFEFKNIPDDIYSLTFSFVGYSLYTVSNVKVSSDSITFLEIKFPCPNGLKHAEKICLMGHTDEIVPIAYGEPTKKAMRKEQHGKIYLGGCTITDCSPTWYCKKHNVTF